jgi:arylsulfatase A-like enzyme
MYPLDTIQLPKTLPTDLEDVPEAGRKVARPQGDHATILKTDNWKHAVQAYLASITFADAMVGRVVKALEESQYADNTIIVLWGDHGWHLGEKQHWRKFTLWEEATRAPLMMVAPGVTRPNSVCHRTVDFMNIYPTLAELCGLPISDHLEGVSFVPLLKNPEAEWDRPAITTHGRNNHAIRSERFRYIRYADGSEELYDHEADPLEWKNLAEDSQFAEAKAGLAQWLPKRNVPDAEANTQPRGNANRRRNRAHQQQD